MSEALILVIFYRAPRLTEATSHESHWLRQEEEGAQRIRHLCLNTSSVTFSPISLVRVSRMAIANFNEH